MWFTLRSRLHSDFNYTQTTYESKGAVHLVRRGAGLVIAVVTLVRLPGEPSMRKNV